MGNSMTAYDPLRVFICMCVCVFVRPSSWGIRGSAGLSDPRGVPHSLGHTAGFSLFERWREMRVCMLLQIFANLKFPQTTSNVFEFYIGYYIIWRSRKKHLRYLSAYVIKSANRRRVHGCVCIL